MLIFSEIIEALKAHKKFKYEHEVADLIGMPLESFRSAKSRELLPYEKILKFCENHPISADWVFFRRGKPEEPGFDQATPQEKEFIDKALKVYRNPATKEGIESTVDTMAKVPLSDSETE